MPYCTWGNRLSTGTRQGFDAVIMLGALCVITSSFVDAFIATDRHAIKRVAITVWCCMLTYAVVKMTSCLIADYYLALSSKPLWHKSSCCIANDFNGSQCILFCP